MFRTAVVRLTPTRQVVRFVGSIKLYVVTLHSVGDTRTSVAVVSSIFVTKQTET